MPKLIVLTGGPGAGKTAVLDMAKRMFLDRVALLHEAASMIYGGGFLRRSTPNGIRAAQRAIYHVQREQERVLEEDGLTKVGLCDRGTLDGLAYWPEPQENFFKELNTTREAEFARYTAVIHMRTPNDEFGYNNDNPARIENSKEAAMLDRKMLDIWKGHPNHFIVDSRHDFLHKAEEVIDIIKRFI
ncbi:MAG: ATP-binding protein [Myxococcaceae bacterium]